MDKPKKFEDCFEIIPETITANNWASICKALGGAMVGFSLMLGIIVGANAEDSGFLIFLAILSGGFVTAVGFWILGAILETLASSAQSNAETARMTYWQLCNNTKTAPQKNSAIQAKKKTANEDSLQEKIPFTEPLIDSESEESNAIWTCAYCGVENEPWDNVCNYCGKKKVD